MLQTWAPGAFPQGWPHWLLLLGSSSSCTVLPPLSCTVARSGHSSCLSPSRLTHSLGLASTSSWRGLRGPSLSQASPPRSTSISPAACLESWLLATSDRASPLNCPSCRPLSQRVVPPSVLGGEEQEPFCTPFPKSLSPVSHPSPPGEELPRHLRIR